MCGITGWIDFHRPLRNEHKVIENMSGTLGLRGPDAAASWAEAHVVFGHTRLIVVDPAGGGQPMTRKHRGFTYTICYNGELYNTEDIRQELLKQGYTFLSHSDTEVLLTAYIHWREQCVDMVNGIFAFAVWDEERNHVFLARDRLGVKPLFFHKLGEGLLFASEMKAILQHPDVAAAVDEEGLREILGLSPSRTPGHGVYKGMEELRPAHWMRVSTDGIVTRRYWQVKSEKHTDSVEETAEYVRALVVDAVERQLVSDVPVGTFLSGGVDSSAITAIAAQFYQKNDRGTLKTYSIDYEENEKYFRTSKFQPNADAPWIKLMTENFRTDHRGCVIANEVLYDYLHAAVMVRDLPGMADIDSSLLWFCRQIKQEVTVGLSGECADEIFGGYPWFHDERLMNRPIFPWMTSVLEREAMLQERWKSRLNLQAYAEQRYQETLAEVPLLPEETGIDKKRRELFYVNMIWFMTTLLDRKDRMSMGASLEVRVPFADHRLVEYVWNIPWEMKMHGNREKGILRKALEGILPEEILYRKKSPYPKTHHPVYTQAVTNSLSEIVRNGDTPLLELFDKKALEQLVETNGASFARPYFGQLMTGPQLIAHLIQLHIWLTEYGVELKE
ncbi:asparagine synthase (glutamine-hydrolysing) [Evansella caseinilytica]|uniref:asparagine synthase (glutamine-hydrolyzing) n=1 Tax=Evansella caseinilytica TaxID=1503961 RepID=A0A1H3L3M5_9BACI|nr:asparagine synthase (glutamine-hydrolyzing) [Evansella caseinilytica]SDY58960.1 asparagine synthase (glutamine-hydrolysing) [Evansella caseinilytica]